MAEERDDERERQLAVQIPAGLLRAVKVRVVERELTLRVVVREALEAWLAR